MSMVFAGFMDAARRDREKREEREAEEKLFEKKFEQDKYLKNMTLYNQQKLTDAALGKQADLLMSQHGIPSAYRGQLVSYLDVYKPGEINEMIESGHITFDGPGGGVGVSAPAGTPGQVTDRAATAYRFFVEKGESPIMAAGIVGNLMQESGAGLNPAAVGDGGNAYGIAQWNGPRKRRYQSWARENGRPVDDFNTQLEFLHWEGTASDEANNWAAARDAATPQEAAKILSVKFWRPGKPHLENRMAHANSIYQTMMDDTEGSEQTEQMMADSSVAVEGKGDFSFGTPVDDKPEATPASYSTSGSTPASVDQQTEEGLGGGFRYNPGGRVELDELYGRDPTYITQWRADNEDRLTPDQRAKVDSIEKAARDAQIDPDLHTQPEKIGKMAEDEIAVHLRLAQETGDVEAAKVWEIALETKQAYGEPKHEWQDISKVRSSNWEALAAAATAAGDDEQAANIERVGQRMARKDRNISDETFIITYTDATGNEVTTSANRTGDGSYMPLIGTQEDIPADRVTKAYTPDEADAAEKSLARFNEKVLSGPREAKLNLATMVESALSLDNIIKSNDSILTTVGGAGSSAINRIKNEFNVLNEMFKDGATNDEINAYIDKTAGTVAGNAADHAAFLSEVTRFAFKYAAIGLGQDGRGLSDQDFQNAFKIVQQGSEYSTFSSGLRNLTKSAIAEVNRKVESASKDAAVIQYRENHPKFAHQINPALTDAETYLNDVGLSQGIEWSDTAPVTVEAGSGGTELDPTTVRDDRVNLVLNMPIFDKITELYHSRETPEAKQRFIDTLKRDQELTDAELQIVLQKMGG